MRSRFSLVHSGARWPISWQLKQRLILSLLGFGHSRDPCPLSPQLKQI